MERLKTKTHTAPRMTNIMARDKYYYRVYLDGILTWTYTR